jgi:zinc transport system ATP-binding protein
MNNDIILDAKNISFQYIESGPEILKNISFSIKQSEALGILGPNGGGKSTLMKILSGLLKMNSGKLKILDKEIHSLDDYPKNFISYVPQVSGLSLILPLTGLEYLNSYVRAINLKIEKKQINELAVKVGIDNKLDYKMKNMSGGEQQRILLLKALLNNPSLLLLDEPTKGLDSIGQDQLLSILKRIQKENKTSVVIVDHNINQIIRHCDKILCLNQSSHWHDHKDLLTKNVLENIYHCEFEHLLIHENEGPQLGDATPEHHFCNHNSENPHHHSKHEFIRGKK